jgi:hypothetical protein
MMFRLPLRKERMSRDFELSYQIVTLGTIDRLFARFPSDVFNCLLFVNSVRSIQQSEVDERTGKLVKLYAVAAIMTSEDQEEHDDLARCLREPSAWVSNGSLKISEIRSLPRLLCTSLLRMQHLQFVPTRSDVEDDAERSRKRRSVYCRLAVP